MVIYRVDGVSGLNVLTGINAKVFYQQLFEVSEPSILSLAGNQLSVRKHAVLPAFRAERSGEIIKALIERNIFFELFLNGFLPLQHHATTRNRKFYQEAMNSFRRPFLASWFPHKKFAERCRGDSRAKK